MIILDTLVVFNYFKLMVKLLVDDTEVIPTGSYIRLPIKIKTKVKLFLAPIFEAEFNKLHNEIGVLKANIKELESDLNPYGLPLFMALESILQDKRAFYEPGTATFKLKDGKFSKEINVDPRDLICVYTPVKGRKKAFVLREDVSTSSGKPREIYKLYELNNNELNYEEIKKMVDPLSCRFVQITKDTLVNVAYYHFDKKNELIFEKESGMRDVFLRFTVKMKNASELFSIVKMHWQENYSLQKRITDYMNGETGSGRP